MRLLTEEDIEAREDFYREFMQNHPMVEPQKLNNTFLQKVSTYKYPISEVFGPTTQGEGPLAGRRTFFVRFAGCDWDCSWCDTKYAVLPKYPGWKKEMLTVDEIHSRLQSLGLQSDDWITLSGGNPALFVDAEFVARFGGTYKLAMETQGSRRLSLDVHLAMNCLVVSPKPPSSGMSNRFEKDIVWSLLQTQPREYITALKFVAFDGTDLEWIHWASQEIGEFQVPRYLSVGTPLAPQHFYLDPNLQYPDDENVFSVRQAICDNLQYFFEITAKDVRFKNFIVFPQLHALAWGQKAGV